MAHDRDEIVEKINLYALALDTRRWDLFDRIFTEHCDADYGAAKWTDREQFKADFAALHAPFEVTQHMMTNHQVTLLESEHAHSLTYGSWRLVRRAADEGGNGSPWEATGWYDDEWVRTHGGWRIARRACRLTWSTGKPKVIEAGAGAYFDQDATSLYIEGVEGKIMYLNIIS